MCIHASNAVLVEEEVEELLALPEGTLKDWRAHGFGPHYLELAADELRYYRSDVDSFLSSRRKNAQGVSMPQWNQ